jgi:hypothetical protein|tara:strand:- start:1614 stop:1820 length:207 start_codon:yes stop_codon:yes gene_type:complete
MNYDNWKLQAADNDGDVTSCCGAYEEVKESLAHDEKIYYCSECGETNDFYSIIEQYEYDERQQYRHIE